MHFSFSLLFMIHLLKGGLEKEKGTVSSEMRACMYMYNHVYVRIRIRMRVELKLVAGAPRMQLIATGSSSTCEKWTPLDRYRYHIVYRAGKLIVKVTRQWPRDVFNEPMDPSANATTPDHEVWTSSMWRPTSYKMWSFKDTKVLSNFIVLIHCPGVRFPFLPSFFMNDRSIYSYNCSKLTEVAKSIPGTPSYE